MDRDTIPALPEQVVTTQRKIEEQTYAGSKVVGRSEAFSESSWEIMTEAEEISRLVSSHQESSAVFKALTDLATKIGNNK
jgi:hypothetical protein